MKPGSLLGKWCSARVGGANCRPTTDVSAFCGQLGSTGFSGCRQRRSYVRHEAAVARRGELNDLAGYGIYNLARPGESVRCDWPSRSSLPAGVQGGSTLRLALRRERANFLGQLEYLTG